MPFEKKRFREIIEATLWEFDSELDSTAAVNLLLGTAAAESDFGTYLRQRGGGPAKGVFQIEPNTFNWLRGVYRDKYPELAGREASELVSDLRLSIIMARLRYRVVKEPLPPADDIHALALYWKEHFNTYHGAGTVEDFEKKYAEYVDG